MGDINLKESLPYNVQIRAFKSAEKWRTAGRICSETFANALAKAIDRMNCVAKPSEILEYRVRCGNTVISEYRKEGK